MIERLGEAETVLAVGNPFSEPSEFGADPGRIRAEEHRRKAGEAKPFPDQISFKHLQSFAEKLLGLSKVARPVQAEPRYIFPAT